MSTKRITMLVHCFTNAKEHGNAVAIFTNPANGMSVSACMWGVSNALALAQEYARGGVVYKTAEELQERRRFRVRWEGAEAYGMVEGSDGLRAALRALFPVRRVRASVKGGAV